MSALIIRVQFHLSETIFDVMLRRRGCEASDWSDCFRGGDGPAAAMGMLFLIAIAMILNHYRGACKYPPAKLGALRCEPLKAA
jgi:hypothetical protein